MKVHDLSEKDFAEWRKARMESGKEKYHHLDHKRNHIVDMVEELLDMENILERMLHHHPEFATDENVLLTKVIFHTLLIYLQKISYSIGDLDDSNSPPRIYWEEEPRIPCEEDKKSLQKEDITKILKSLLNHLETPSVELVAQDSHFELNWSQDFNTCQIGPFMRREPNGVSTWAVQCTLKTHEGGDLKQ